MFEAIQKETFITTQAKTNSHYQPWPLHSAKSHYCAEQILFNELDEQSHFNDRYRPRAN